MDSSHVILSELQVVAVCLHTAFPASKLTIRVPSEYVLCSAFLALLVWHIISLQYTIFIQSKSKVYDTLLQINQEYLHVWKSRWTLIKCLYLWTRYSTFVDTTMALLHIVHANASVCNHSMMFTTIFSGFGIGITEMILMVRTYTLYERSKKLLAFFFLLWFSVGGVSFWAAIKWTAQFRPATSSEVPECNLGDLVGTVCYISLLVGETVIVFLTLWKCFRRFSPHNSGLLNSFYRDGVWFYLAILPFTVGTVVALFVAPAGLNSIMDTPVRVVHSILCCRLVTHAREMAAKEDRNKNKTKFNRYPYSPMDFGKVVDVSPGNNV
ncbi:hypothetical protein B0H10DRAFT_2191061 [Mycena sp. CBHHK59/15]|nr:hypothetical protein B0H10DRAFT_2191061 [Mycena sp. CBHHK59/15]